MFGNKVCCGNFPEATKAYYLQAAVDDRTQASYKKSNWGFSYSHNSKENKLQSDHACDKGAKEWYTPPWWQEQATENWKNQATLQKKAYKIETARQRKKPKKTIGCYKAHVPATKWAAC